MSPVPTYEEYMAVENKFERACAQLRTINSKIASVQLRYDRAASTNRRSFRYSLRIQLVELEGVRNMFWQYARKSAEDLDSMKQTILDSLAQSEREEEMAC